MKKIDTVLYRFLPAINLHNSCAHEKMAFSDVIKKAIHKHVLTEAKVSYFDKIACFNDTGIFACGQQCEHVQSIYLYTHNKLGKLKEATVIITIIDDTTKQLRFFKGFWSPIQLDITVWCELMPDIAKQEIAYLETIIS